MVSRPARSEDVVAQCVVVDRRRDVSARRMGGEIGTPTVARSFARVRGEEARLPVLETKLIAPPVRPGTAVRAELLVPR